MIGWAVLMICTSFLQAQPALACPSFGCDGALSFNFLGSLNPSPALKWKTSVDVDKRASLQCSSRTDRVICTLSQTAASEFHLSLSNSTMFAFGPEGKNIWRNSFLLPSPSYPVLDVQADAFISDGRFLQTLSKAGKSLAPQEDVFPSLFPLLQTPSILPDDIIMLSSSTGNLAGYLIDGTPFASLQLNTTWPGVPARVIPLTPHVASLGRIYFVAQAEHTQTCALYSFDVTRSLSHRLSLAWRNEMPCAHTTPLASYPFVLANDGITCTSTLDRSARPAISCVNDTGDAGNLLFTLPLSSPVSAFAVLSSDQPALIVAQHNSPQFLVINTSSYSIQTTLNTCTLFPSCLYHLSGSQISIGSLADGSRVLLALVTLQPSSPSSFEYIAINLDKNTAVWRVPVPIALSSAISSQIVPLSIGQSTVTVIAHAGTIAAFG